MPVPGLSQTHEIDGNAGHAPLAAGDEVTQELHNVIGTLHCLHLRVMHIKTGLNPERIFDADRNSAATGPTAMQNTTTIDVVTTTGIEPYPVKNSMKVKINCISGSIRWWS